MKHPGIKEAMLELCAEDNYGLWELYWSYRGLVRGADCSDEEFLNALQELITQGKIDPYDKNQYTGKFDRTTFELGRARSELEDIKRHKITDRLYWFGRDSGNS
jgi:hypothetical protein